MELNLETKKAVKTIVGAMVAISMMIRISYLRIIMEIAKCYGSNIASIVQDVKVVELLAEETIDGDNSLVMAPYDPPYRNPDLPADW